MGDVKRHDTFMDEHDKKSKAVKESRSDRDASNRQRVAKLRPIDDCLFEKLEEDRGVCEEMLRVILEETDFPEELVANTTLAKLKSSLKRNKKV